MIASPLANYSQKTHPSNYQGLKKISSGELFGTSKSVSLARDIDPVDSFRQLVELNHENRRHLILKYLRSFDAARGLKKITSGEPFSTLKSVSLEREIDPVDSVRQLVELNHESRTHLLQKYLRSFEAVREYGQFPLDSELKQLLRTEGYSKEKESHDDQSSLSIYVSVPYHASKNSLEIDENNTLRTGRQKAVQNWYSKSQQSNHGDKALVLLAQAKKLLSEQRIQEARRILQSGTHQYPKDTGIARLLNAISPGQVTKVKSEAANGNQEIAWIRQHGKKYQEQWIAVRNNELLASSRTLKSLLDKLKHRKGKVEPVTIQYIVPE